MLLCVNLTQRFVLATELDWLDMIIPEGYHTITPYFTVSDADQLLEFLVEVFGGAIIVNDQNATGRVQHARVRIGDSIIMLNESNEHYPVNVSQMHLYVNDVDAVYCKALSVGAVSIMKPNVRPHGDRMAGFKDPLGNIWWVARSATP